jgi:hypothetical protein
MNFLNLAPGSPFSLFVFVVLMANSQKKLTHIQVGGYSPSINDKTSITTFCITLYEILFFFNNETLL